jgi:hypothetical protein
MLALVIGSTLAAAAPAISPVHALDIEARLGSLIGDWTRAGKETSYRDSCVWYDAHAFVVCSLTDSAAGTKVEAIIGYSEKQKRFTYQSYGNSGASRVQYGYPLADRGIVFTDEQEVDGKPARLTTRLVLQPDDRLRITLDRSVMGGPWQQAAEVYYIRR